MEQSDSKEGLVATGRGDEENSDTKLLAPSTSKSKESTHAEKPRYSPFFTFISSAKKTIGSKLEHAKEFVKKDEGLVAGSGEVSSSSRNATTFDVTSCQIRRSKSIEGYAVWNDSFKLLRQFRVSGGHPLYAFCQRETGNIFFITSKTIETFDSYCNKILDIRLPVAWEDLSIVAESPEDVSAPKRFTHVGGVGGPQVIPAITAYYIEQLDEVVVAHEDGSLRSYCCTSGSMGVERRNSCLSSRSKDSFSRGSVEKKSQLPSSQRSVAISFYNDFLVTGCADGCIRIWHFETVQSAEGVAVDSIVLTETYEPSLGNLPLMLKPTITAIEVSSLPHEMLPSEGSNDDTAVTVFYANAEGYCGGYSITRQWNCPCFAAHFGPVTGLASLLSGLILLSVGRDGMLSVTETVSGRCMARKRLHYIPTVLFQLKDANASSQDDICKKQELHFIVGGSEGQVELYRLIVMSLSRLEFQLVRKLHERSKNRRAAVSSVIADLESSLIVATFSDKIVRIWRITELDNSMLCMQAPPEISNPAIACFEGPQASFTRENIVSILEPIPFRTRLALYEGLIEAQRVLALALEDSVGLSEQAKDAVVSDFERIQTNFQQRAEKLDSELQISLERIRHRYYHCLLEDYSNEQGLFQWNDVKKQELFFSLLFNVGKELAAFEVNWALYKHHQYLQSLCREVSLQLRASLVNILQRANSHGAKELLDNFPFLSIAE